MFTAGCDPMVGYRLLRDLAADGLLRIHPLQHVFDLARRDDAGVGDGPDEARHLTKGGDGLVRGGNKIDAGSWRERRRIHGIGREKDSRKYLRLDFPRNASMERGIHIDILRNRAFFHPNHER